MNTRIFVAGALALAVIFPATANALTIENRDKTTYTVKFTPTGGKRHNMTVAARSHHKFDCSDGGLLQLGKTNMICDSKTAHVTIKSGKLEM